MATPKGYQFDDDFLDQPASATCPSLKCRSPTDPAEAVRERRRRLHRRLDQHGPGGRSAKAPQGFRRLPGERQADGQGASRRVLHALPAGPSRRGSDRRSDRRPAQHRRAAGRQSDARAKGNSGLALGRSDAASRELRPRNFIHATRRPRERRAAPDHAQAAIHPAGGRQRADHAPAAPPCFARPRRSHGAALDDRQGTRLGHRRVRHAPRQHQHRARGATSARSTAAPPRSSA